MIEKLNELRSKYREHKMRKWKPEVVNRWYDSLDKKIHKEYEEELEKLGDELYCARQELNEARNDRDRWKHRYEESQEVQEKLLNKVEKTSTKAGALRTEVKHLSTELKETKESSQESNISNPLIDGSTVTEENENSKNTQEIIDRISNELDSKKEQK